MQVPADPCGVWGGSKRTEIFYYYLALNRGLFYNFSILGTAQILVVIPHTNKKHNIIVSKAAAAAVVVVVL